MAQSFAEAVSWVPVSATFSSTLGRAHEYARAQHHRAVTLEHLLLALAEDPDAAVVLQASTIDIGRLMNEASTHLGHLDDRFPPGAAADPGADEALVRILDYAAAAARQSRRREINGAIVLAAIVGEGRSVAASLLQSQGLTFEGAIKALQRAPVAAPSAPRPAPALPAAAPEAEVQPASIAPPPPREPPAHINGAAAQSNEEILASVRRRIDANRQMPKTAPPAPAHDIYPAPPEATRPAAPPMPAAQVTVAAPVTARPSAPVVTAPAQPVAPPLGDDPIYTGTYPELPPSYADPSLPPPLDEAGLQPERFEASAQPARPEPPARRPPPVPPLRKPNPISEAPQTPLRPRQLGAPVAPPTTVPWPEPVRPQPAALPPAYDVAPPYAPPYAARDYEQQSYDQPSTSAPPTPRSFEPPTYPSADPYDGGIAGAPFPEPDSVPVPAIAAGSAPVRAARPPAAAAPSSAPALDQGQLAESIPRQMRVGKIETVEVRIGRSNARAITDGLAGSAPSYLHSLIVTKAMSVRLRSLDGALLIESASPETQWIDNRLGTDGDDFASWRWNVTPLRRGTGKVQLIVSARTVASDGLSADTMLPDQMFEISIQADHAKSARKVAGWVGLMVLGGVLSRIGQTSFETVAALWRGFQ